MTGPPGAVTGATGVDLSSISDLIPGDATVLLVSRGGSALTEALARRGCRVTAIECDRRSAAVAGAFSERLVCTEAGLPSVLRDLGGGGFDVAVFVDVLEAALRPAEALGQAVRLLRSDGAIVVSLRNLTHAAARAAVLTGRAAPTGDGEANHDLPGLFTLERARALLAAAGLETTRLERLAAPASDGLAGAAVEDLSPAMQEWLREQPEAETTHFIFRCRPGPVPRADGPQPEARLSDRGYDAVVRLQADALIEMEARLRESQAQRGRAERLLLEARARMTAKLQEVQADRERLMRQVERQASLIRAYEDSRAVRLASAGRRVAKTVLKRIGRR